MMTEPRYELTKDEGYQLIRTLIEICIKTRPTEGMTAVDAGRALEGTFELANGALKAIPQEILSHPELS